MPIINLFQPPPIWTPNDHHYNVIYAPHWYDLKTLFTKTFNGKITHDVQRLTKVIYNHKIKKFLMTILTTQLIIIIIYIIQGAHHIVSSTFFGLSGAKKNYSGQVRNTVKNGLQYVGEKPCVLGECGIP